MLTMAFSISGCAQIATNVAVQASIQLAGEQYLMATNKPITRCTLVNVAKGNKLCRVNRVYAKNTSNN